MHFTRDCSKARQKKAVCMTNGLHIQHFVASVTQALPEAGAAPEGHAVRSGCQRSAQGGMQAGVRSKGGFRALGADMAMVLNFRLVAAHLPVQLVGQFIDSGVEVGV